MDSVTSPIVVVVPATSLFVFCAPSRDSVKLQYFSFCIDSLNILSLRTFFYTRLSHFTNTILLRPFCSVDLPY